MVEVMDVVEAPAPPRLKEGRLLLLPPGFLSPREVESSPDDEDLDFVLDLPNLNFFMADLC